MHLAPYAWLYDTPLYLVTSGALSVLAVGATVILERRIADQEAAAVAGATALCFTASGVLLASAAVAASL